MTSGLETRSSQVVGERDAERAGEVAGTAAQIVRCRSGDRRARRSAIRRNAVDRRQRANQHGRGMSFRLGHRVHEVMDAVVQIDVGEARRSIQRRVPARRPRRRVAGRIVLADVGLGLDDHPGRLARRRAMHEHLAEQLFGDGQRRPLVELAREDDRSAPVAPPGRNRPQFLTGT